MEVNRQIILKIINGKGDVLKPNQGELSLPIINRIYKKMAQELKFQPIHVSADNLIIDGHHRYISSILSNFPLDVVTDYPKPSVLNNFDWNSVEFTEDDWDSPSKIKMLNKQDAHYNGMKIEAVQRIIE